MNSHIQSVVDRLPSQGYVGLAPSMFHREGPMTTGLHEEMDTAIARMRRCTDDNILSDVRAAVDYIKAQSFVQGDKIGIVGFCMGGQLALFAASKNQRIVACVDFYGIHPNVKPDYSKLKAPVLGLFAEKDGFVSPDVVNALEQALGNAGVSTDFQIYPDVDHAFFNDEREVYNLAAATDAWNRVHDFFEKHIKYQGAS